jgi:hypothetical protein
MAVKTKKEVEKKVNKVVLSAADTKEIENTFTEATDFRSI